MQMPILTDTEAETSVDLEASIGQLKPVSTTANSTKSLFNINLQEAFGHNKSLEMKSYEAHLQEEIREWSSLFRNSIQQLKEAKKTPHPVIDVSILSAENRAYLDDAPDLQNFVRGSVEFRQEAHIFLEKYCKEMQEAQQALVDVCEHVTNVIKESKIAQNLANQ